MLIYKHCGFVEQLKYHVGEHRRRPRSRITPRNSLTGKVKPIVLDFTDLRRQSPMKTEEQENDNQNYKKPKYKKSK